MLFEQLSFWEKRSYLQGLDFVIVGAGIVGTTSSLFLKERFPNARILVIDKGILPHSASTKNAGFACFGSPAELLDDLTNMPEETVWETVALRWKGLQDLRSLVPDRNMEFLQKGSYDLLLNDSQTALLELDERLPYLNQKLFEITGHTSVFSKLDSFDSFGFSGVKAMFFNRLEGQLNPVYMMDFLQARAREKGIRFLSGMPLQSFRSELYGVQLLTPFGTIRTANLILATNGFSQELLPGYSVLPARAQVLVTSPIEKLPWEGTFHADRGYYYFRNIENRVLLGGGRNLDVEGETNVELVLNEKIQSHLEELLRNVILPGSTFSIEHRWSGIMGVGHEKNPIIEKIHDRIAVGVRMGGMGVAIGTNVGRKLAELF